MKEYLTFHVHKSAIEENDFKEHVNFYVGPSPSEDFVTLYTAEAEDAVLAEREACAAIADIALLGCERSIRDRVVHAIRERGEK